MKRCLVLGSLSLSLINFRGALLDDLRTNGFEVLTAAPGGDLAVEKEIARRGFSFHPVDLDRTGMNPIRDLNTLSGLVALLRSIKPTHMLSYTIKPVLYGGLAARIVGGVRTVPILTGMGSLFTADNVAARGGRYLVEPLLRVALGGNSIVLVQNPDDQKLVLERGLVESVRLRRIAGSGVDLEYFSAKPMTEGPGRFLMIARLLIDKGVREFVAAAKRVKEAYPKAEFDLVGPQEHHARAIPQAEVERWREEGIVKLHGMQQDVRPFIEACNVYVLPSYREGMPRSVLEAMAVGRPIITTDAPGCRSAIEDGVSGRLVQVGDVDSLENAMLELAGRLELRNSMASAAARRAREVFDVRKVNRDILDALGE